MSSEQKPILVSVSEERKKEVNEVLDGLKAREMPKSATICHLLVDFKNNGYEFRKEAKLRKSGDNE